MRPLLFFQTGDFRETCQRFAAGGEETYLDQRRSVQFVRDLARQRPVVVAARSRATYDEELEPGLRAIGIAEGEFFAPACGAEVVRRTQPAALVVRLPHAGVLAAAAAGGVPTLASLADIMQPTRWWQLPTRAGLRRVLHHRRLAKLLRAPNVHCVANHSLTASRSLHQVLGLPRDRIVPWEWTRLQAEPSPPERADRGTFTLFYAGLLLAAKGVGDLLRATASLRATGRPLHVVLAGQGAERPALEQLREALGLSSCVEFVGMLPNREVRARMRQADAVVVPSRPAYDEGLPNVIFEALAARAPLVVSDHPAFARRLTAGRDCLMARAADPADLAAQLARLHDDAGLRATLVANGPAALASLYVGVSWYDLVAAFAADPTNTSGWMQPWTLQALGL